MSVFHWRPVGSQAWARAHWYPSRALPPGRRTSYPHAESDEEEFVYVLEGYPKPGLMAICGNWSRATAWVFLPEPVLPYLYQQHGRRGAVTGRWRGQQKHNRIYYPLNPVYAATREDRWVDHPPQFLDRMMENLGKNNFLFYKY
jgi:hypothetical protein